MNIPAVAWKLINVGNNLAEDYKKKKNNSNNNNNKKN